MAFKFAERMSGIKASEIRELLKLTQKPDIISFAGGLPAAESFPVKEFSEVAQQVMAESGTKALQYGPTEGVDELRKEIAKRMAKVQVPAEFTDIMITSGSQQGLDFSAKLFIDPGDTVICEAPSYLGALNAFKAYQPNFVEVETDDDGMRMDKLEEALKSTKNAKFIYVIPDFQNPTGRTLPLERRKRLVELANRYDIVVVEDNPYGELRFEGEILPAIKHFDTEGRVVFLGTFSKILSPGVRLGWVCASEEILSKYVMIKQGADLQSSTISQMETAKLLQSFDIEKHIQKIIDLYSKRKNLMVETMKKEFPSNVSWTDPEGGLFLWVMLPEGANARDIAVKALEQKVAYVPGGSFYPVGGHENCFRMNYSCMSEEKIVEGIQRLGKVLKEELK
ncbi:MAG: PLP-dependent aminotransferase family protein [Peptostreptococcaceae bacterium]|nr:PLP-dependent aminotransferase family protein [Peptostreptococcaceae bacterium]